ncbi:hypothetical protein DLH72_03930 [Candidatus Gracilibacteria bacterium]|nr:MAG: hypothetical protein DLH72_03930 [Candidatus Gracilibacteria bacterium]
MSQSRSGASIVKSTLSHKISLVIQATAVMLGLLFAASTSSLVVFSMYLPFKTLIDFSAHFEGLACILPVIAG